MKLKPSADELSMHARALLESSIVWDNVWPIDLPTQESFGNTWAQLERFAKAGVTTVGLTLAGDNHSAAEALRLTGWARSNLRAQSSRLKLVRTAQDILTAKHAGQIAVVLQFEGTRCFERDLNLIELFYDLGVRQTLLAFNNANSAGGGCADRADAGLTGFGRRFVREAERAGMLIDLSHVGRKTSLDALDIAHKPMVFSHSNANSIHRCFRNIDDDQALTCARAGGLIGVSGSSEYLGDQQCRTESLFYHLDHFVQLVGAQHVGIGLDVVFDAHQLSLWAKGRPDEWPMTQDPTWPGFNYVVPEQLIELVTQMLRHGYTHDSIRAILGENYLRVCRQVWSS